MKKNLITGLLVLVLAALGVLYWQTRTHKTNGNPTNPENKKIEDIVAEQKITNFTLQGDVTRVEGDIIYINAGTVKDGKFVVEERPVIYDKSVKVTKTANGKTTDVKVSEVKVGSKITVHTATNIYKQGLSLFANQIDIN